MSNFLFWESFGVDEVEKIVRSLGMEMTGENSEWIYCYCPYHNNKDTRAAEVNVESGFFYCFACDTKKSLLDLVMDRHGSNEYAAMRYIHDFKQETGTVDIGSLLNDELRMFDADLLERLHDELLSSTKAQQYLIGRGINEVAWNKYLLGYSTKRNMITIPIEHPYKQAHVGFVARSLEGKVFLNSKGLPRKHTLFGISKIGDVQHIYLTESALDAMLIDEAGKPAVASLGSTISDQQLSMLSRWRDIIVVQDNDAAGEKLWQRVHSKLPKHTVRHVVWPDNTYNDVGESGVDYVIKHIGG